MVYGLVVGTLDSKNKIMKNRKQKTKETKIARPEKGI